MTLKVRSDQWKKSNGRRKDEWLRSCKRVIRGKKLQHRRVCTPAAPRPTDSCKRFVSKGMQHGKMGGMGIQSNCVNPCSTGGSDYCRAAPDTPSHLVQQALESRFGIRVSISHLNATRAALARVTDGCAKLAMLSITGVVGLPVMVTDAQGEQRCRLNLLWVFSARVRWAMRLVLSFSNYRKRRVRNKRAAGMGHKSLFCIIPRVNFQACSRTKVRTAIPVKPGCLITAGLHLRQM